MLRFPVTKIFCVALATATASGLASPSPSGGPRDIKAFIKTIFKPKIEAIKSGFYCRALSCQFEVENFFITEMIPKTYALSTSGWLEGTIPGLKGSARRAVGLTGTYILGTCIVKDLKPVFDVSTNNNGWGASKIEAAFSYIEIPKLVVLAPDDCAKVDNFLITSS